MTGSWSIDILSCKNYYHRTKKALHVVPSLSLAHLNGPSLIGPLILLRIVRSQLILYNTEPAVHNSTIKHVTPLINLYTNTHSSRRNTQLIKEENGTECKENAVCVYKHISPFY